MSDVIKTDKAPAAIGPYSQGRLTGEFIFASGQIPVVPENGSMPEGIKEQAEQAIKNLSQVLIAGGSSLDGVIKTTVFITDMDNFAAVNEVYGQYFKEPYPARSCVEVGRLPKGALIEIEAIAKK